MSAAQVAAKPESAQRVLSLVCYVPRLVLDCNPTQSAERQHTQFLLSTVARQVGVLCTLLAID